MQVSLDVPIVFRDRASPESSGYENSTLELHETRHQKDAVEDLRFVSQPRGVPLDQVQGYYYEAHPTDRAKFYVIENGIQENGYVICPFSR